MKNRAKIGNKKGNPAYRTPARLCAARDTRGVVARARKLGPKKKPF